MAPRKKPEPIDGVIEREGGLLARTNTMFVELRRVGELGSNGRVRFARGYRGKIIAKPDQPLMLFAALVEQFVFEGFPYSSKDAAAVDAKKFKAFVDEWAKLFDPPIEVNLTKPEAIPPSTPNTE